MPHKLSNLLAGEAISSRCCFSSTLIANWAATVSASNEGSFTSANVGMISLVGFLLSLRYSSSSCTAARIKAAVSGPLADVSATGLIKMA